MNESLFEPAPDFDQPIAVLKHCHDKIRKQIKTLERLVEYLPKNGATLEAQQAATAVLHYFNQAGPFHHADEEHDLIPMLQTLAGPDDATVLAELIPQILQEHKQMDPLWHGLQRQLNAIVQGHSAHLSAQDIQDYAALYQSHMTKEEGVLAPMALRLLDPQHMQQLGAAMQARRNQAPPASEPDAAAHGDASHATPTPAELDLSDLRREYRHAQLSSKDVAPDPIAQFTTWFAEAQKAQVLEPNAMSVSTVALNGRPSSRIVLIKQCDARGFTFFTNYHSRKGMELQHNQFAALLFYWPELERQVRIEGKIEIVSRAESEGYFHSRPLGSRLSALASDQSQVIPSRADMERRHQEVSQRHGEHPPCPEHWGGYRLVPDYLEFWQGRSSRFHDRIVYQLEQGSWRILRLQP